MKRRIKEILSWYGSDNPGTLTNLARILNQGKLGGSGKLVILPVDQGVEHGPGRTYVPNPPSFDPRYHFELAIDAGLSAYAAPLGFLEAAARDYAGDLPLILKLNNRENMSADKDPLQAVTGSVQAALRLGCAAIGYTVYPGSLQRVSMYEKLQALTEEAKRHGLVVVVWAYPRGSDISKDGETALDVSAYAAQIAAQMGAHILKVKPPADCVEQAEAKKVYDKAGLQTGTLAERIAHVMQSAFDGRRVTIFSGGAARSTEQVLEEIRGIRDGGGFGSIMGRNAFQRDRTEALALLDQVIKIYQGKL
jgi:class I fructose-bisphosphate aldolase